MDGRKGEEMKEDGRVEWGKGRREEGKRERIGGGDTIK